MSDGVVEAANALRAFESWLCVSNARVLANEPDESVAREGAALEVLTILCAVLADPLRTQATETAIIEPFIAEWIEPDSAGFESAQERLERILAADAAARRQWRNHPTACLGLLAIAGAVDRDRTSIRTYRKLALGVADAVAQAVPREAAVAHGRDEYRLMLDKMVSMVDAAVQRDAPILWDELATASYDLTGSPREDAQPVGMEEIDVESDGWQLLLLAHFLDYFLDVLARTRAEFWSPTRRPVVGTTSTYDAYGAMMAISIRLPLLESTLLGVGEYTARIREAVRATADADGVEEIRSVAAGLVTALGHLLITIKSFRGSGPADVLSLLSAAEAAFAKPARELEQSICDLADGCRFIVEDIRAGRPLKSNTLNIDVDFNLDEGDAKRLMDAMAHVSRPEGGRDRTDLSDLLGQITSDLASVISNSIDGHARAIAGNG